MVQVTNISTTPQSFHVVLQPGESADLALVERGASHNTAREAAGLVFIDDDAGRETVAARQDAQQAESVSFPEKPQRARRRGDQDAPRAS